MICLAVLRDWSVVMIDSNNLRILIVLFAVIRLTLGYSDASLINMNISRCLSQCCNNGYFPTPLYIIERHKFSTLSITSVNFSVPQFCKTSASQAYLLFSSSKRMKEMDAYSIPLEGRPIFEIYWYYLTKIRHHHASKMLKVQNQWEKILENRVCCWRVLDILGNFHAHKLNKI